MSLIIVFIYLKNFVESESWIEIIYNHKKI